MSESVIERSDSTKLSDTLPPPTFEREVLQAAKGGGITFVGKLVTLATRFATAFILARLLGASQYGLYNLSVSALWIAVPSAVPAGEGRIDVRLVWTAWQLLRF